VNRVLLTTLIYASITVPAVAKDNPLVILGLTLGQPLNLPECHYSSPVDPHIGKIYDSSASITNKCIEDYGRPPYLNLELPMKDTPLIVSNFGATLTIVDNNLVGVSFLTRGVDSQTFVMGKLREKYGAPTRTSHHRVQNGMGAVFDSLTAQWQIGKVQVTFLGVYDGLDRGIVYVEFPAATAIRKSEERDTGPKL
jgi:hypothetical protein